MACSCVTPNYKGPAVGIWALVLALQFAVGTLMIFMGSRSISDVTSAIEDLRYNQEISQAILDGNAWSVVNALGWLHLVISVVCGAFVILGMFVCSIFLCPLCILGWVQCLYCMISTFTTGTYLRGYLDTLPASSDTVWNSSTGNVFFAQLNSGGLLAASVLSFTASIIFSRASRVSSGESVPGASLMVYSMALFASMGALLGAGGGGWPPTPALTALWVLLTFLGAILMNIRGCFCKKACNVLMIILFGVGTLLGLITTVVMAHIYVTVVKDPLARPDFTNLAIVMERGTGLVVAAVLSIAGWVMAAFATVYSARSLLCCGPGVSSS